MRLKIKKNQLKELIRQSIREIDFKNQDAFDAYNKKHKMRKSTKVNVAGKDTTAGKADAMSKGDVGGPSYPNVPKGVKSSDDLKGKKPDAADNANKKMEIDVLNSKAEKGKGVLIDTEHHGSVVWDHGDSDEDTFMAIDQDGETVELDYSDIIRFQNDGEDESMLKNVQGQGDDFDDDDTGGPSYANVPKGAKTSKQAKQMKKDKEQKKVDKQTMKAADDANAKMDADEKASNKKSKKESKLRKTTVKEVKNWFKSLEENRYKKTYNSDARRVSWLVNNNLSEDYDTMPASMSKKWSKAAYGRERYLAKEFIKHLQSQQIKEHKLRKIIRTKLLEQKLRETIRGIIKEAKRRELEIHVRDKIKTDKILKKLRLKPGKHYDIGFGSSRSFILDIDVKYLDKVITILMKNRINVK